MPTKKPRGHVPSLKTKLAVPVQLAEYHSEQLLLNGRPGASIASAFSVELANAGYDLKPCNILLSYDVLRQASILIILGPQSRFSLDEIEAIHSYVHAGGGLLFVSDHDIMWQKYRYSLNELAGRFGFVFREYFNRQPKRTDVLGAHAVTTGVNALDLGDACCISPVESVSTLHKPVAWFSDAREDVLALCVEAGKGRVVALGDSALFTEDGWQSEDNQTFILNSLSWLARRNLVDVADVRCPVQIALGQPAHVRVVLSNPSARRLENIHCSIQSSADTEIKDSHVTLRFIPPYETNTLSWSVTPRELGRNVIMLTVEAEGQTVFFDRLVTFRTVIPGQLRAITTDQNGNQQTDFDVDQEFCVEVFSESVEWIETPVNLKPSESIQVIRPQDVPAMRRWVLCAREAGYHNIECVIPASGQTTQVSVYIKPTLERQIEDLKRRLLQPLEAEIVRRLCEVHLSLTDKDIQAIPFRVLSPEQFAELLYPPEIAERLCEVIRAARRETDYNIVLLTELLMNVAPLYSPSEGGCAPFDPELAGRWAKLHPEQREQIEYNFLKAEGSDESTTRQNLAAYLLHEKYGHGYFYTHTTLGRQLGVLYRHGFVRQQDRDHLAVPYPQSLYAEYASAIEALSHSAIIVNEGLAAWIELNFLEQMELDVSRAVFRRKVFLMEQADRLKDLSRRSDYFKAFPPLFKSPYKEGYEKLAALKNKFGSPYGEKCALHVAIKAAEVNLGIEEVGTTVHFALSPTVMRDALLDPDQPDNARADRRLRRITLVLHDNSEHIRTVQRRLQCYRECLHPKCPVYDVIREKLGW